MRTHSRGEPVQNTDCGYLERFGLGDMPGSGDQYFNATMTFNPAPGSGMSEFQPYSSMQSRRGHPRHLSQNAKPFVPTHNPMDQSLANDFAALNLAATSSMVKGSGEYPGQQQSLPHSSSTPSFAALSNMFSTPPPPTTAPVSHVVNNGSGLAFSSGMSPSHSPGISPTSSPHVFRRNPHSSPVPPHRQTTVPQKPNAGTTFHQENVGGTTYFYSPEDFTPQQEGALLPDFTMYNSIPSHIHHMKLKTPLQTFAMADELKMEVLNRQALAGAHVDLAAHPDIPPQVDNYDNLVPLERSLPPSAQAKSLLGYSSTCYKAVNKTDGTLYCLRRVHNFRLNPTLNSRLMTLVEAWNKLYHPNIVQLREAFTTKAFGDSSIVFSYDYFPGAITLMSKHFSNPQPLNGFTSQFSMEGGSSRSFGSKGMNNRSTPTLLSESLIWCYIVQLSSALRYIHSTGLAARTIEPSKILFYDKSRLRVNCVGVMDVLSLPSMDQATIMNFLPHWQQEDLMGLGRIVLALACNTALALQQQNMAHALEFVQRNYSPDLKNLILYLLNNQNRPRTVNDIMPMIGARFFTQLDTAQLRCDVLENEMSKEVENGRLARLIFKLCSILERPEFNMDPSWSETGDRYMLKLFRDYVFHQVDENGLPWMDMAHIVQCLNKLDSGVQEKVCLMTRDEQSIFIVSYSELKRCFAAAFSELLNAGQPSSFA
ncbi:PAN2-PAN3 deadenylation complex subunit Pan3-like isoform X2 [Pomacea canaliculata]|uniref:PAN2-PAN3 deadenylation complex subunit Pan3-like isoform X2 n=1 Tax=Pomacea canaliculata TaxID=400727 RepID=UPI000D7378D5|nr:PAN2-PAN3 deadenylation complex subunit Pan3-like isoform X2 [Pomacea canaliculata]